MSKPRVSLREQGLVPVGINWDAINALVLFFAAFALYARSAAPGVLDGDAGEFQTNIYLLGVSHTGYPLYFMLAKLWTLILPVGSIAYRANVFSGLFGALTLVLIYFTLRTLNFSLLVSLFSSALFAVSRVQWSQSVIPDVYTLNSFFIVLVVWLAILWRMGRLPLWSVALAYGLSLTHHRTMIWLAPALAIFALWSRNAYSDLLLGRRERGDDASGRKIFQPGELWKTIAALFLPLLLYLYIPLRGESFVGVEYHANNFRDMILASNVSVWLRFGPPGFIWERITQVYLPMLVEQFTPLGFALGIIGIVVLTLNRAPRNFPLPPRQFLFLIGVAHLLETAFAIVFWVVDSEIFFIPAYLTFLFFVPIGIAVAWEWVASRNRLRLAGGRRALSRSAFNILLAVGLGTLCGFLLWTNFARNDLSSNDQVDARWREILAQPLEQNAMIMGPWEDLTPLEYFQDVENLRPDLKRRKVIVYRDQLKLVSQGNIAAEANTLLENGSQVYFTRHPDDTETLTGFARSDLVPIASLWRLQARNSGENEERVSLGDDNELRGVAFEGMRRAGEFVTVRLKWSPDAPLEKIRMVLRLRDGARRVWVEQEALPFGARKIEKGERDVQGFFLPPDAPPGYYLLEIQAFERNSQTPISIHGESNLVTQRLDVAAAARPAGSGLAQIPHPLQGSANEVKFLGFDISNSFPRGGDILEFSTWWQNIARADDTLDIKLRDANEVETILYHGALFPNASGQFNPAQLVRARHDITIPPQAIAGYAQLVLSLNGQTLPPIRLSLAESLRRFRVPIIQRPQLTLVGDSMQLLGYKLDRTEFRAGETIPLTLYWSAYKAPPASYKVFVHLVDMNGVLRAQQDSIPQRGTLPTNRWFEGEYITDEYALSLPSDVAAGEYRILVGMYEEESGARVPLFDANNARIANDAVTLGDSIVIP